MGFLDIKWEGEDVEEPTHWVSDKDGNRRMTLISVSGYHRLEFMNWRLVATLDKNDTPGLVLEFPSEGTRFRVTGAVEDIT